MHWPGICIILKCMSKWDGTLERFLNLHAGFLLSLAGIRLVLIDIDGNYCNKSSQFAVCQVD